MAASSPDSGPVPSSKIGGKYEAIGVLGRGGMGVVVEAVHVGVGQHFAVKILRPEYAKNPDAVLRFEREARAAGQLRSPHAVRIFDVDKGADGLPYIVMELLEGHDLSTELDKRKTLPVGEVVDWILQACAALGEAHELGVVHRDLKPSNIFLCMEGTTRVAKVLDFGISKIATVQSVTADGAVFGTPHYMSPEQLRGSKDVDSRSDIWSLGVIMYRLLSGRLPFDADSPSALSIAIATTPETGLDVVCPDLPRELVTAIGRTLSKDPTKRFATTQELADAIAPFGSGAKPLPPRTSLRSHPLPSLASLEEILGTSHTAPTVPARLASPNASTAPAVPLARQLKNSNFVDTSAPTTANRSLAPPSRRLWIAGAVAVVALGVGITLLRGWSPSASAKGSIANVPAVAAHPPARAEPVQPPPSIAPEPAPVAAAPAPTRSEAESAPTAHAASPPQSRAPARSAPKPIPSSSASAKHAVPDDTPPLHL